MLSKFQLVGSLHKYSDGQSGSIEQHGCHFNYVSKVNFPSGEKVQ